ncbi:hypothetical protein MASR1M31_04710 [Porphyromonadaceae bacterium]
MALLGQGTFTVRRISKGVKKIYTRSQLQPITPVGDSPIGWSAVPSAFDAPPNYGNLWSSSATVDPNGVVQGTWSIPTLEEPYTSNPLDRFPFVVGTGDQYPYTQYGTDNIREIGLNPFGVSDVIWRGKSHISTSFCGGIDTTATYYYNLDNSKKYRASFWFKRNTWSEGTVYFGLKGNVQSYGTVWGDTSNYYFLIFPTFQSAVIDKWYLIVGYILPSTDEYVFDPRSGIYDGTTGNLLRVLSGTPRQKEGVYKVGIRLAQYNCPTTYPEFRIWQPRIDLCDGREPSIEQLLKGSPKTPTITISGETVFKFSSGQTIPENTSITLSAELTNGATSYQWQYFRISDSTWVNLSSGTSQTYSLPHNSSAFQSTSRIQIRCTTVVAGTTYTSNVLTISKLYDGVPGSPGLNNAIVTLYKRSSSGSPDVPPVKPASGSITYNFTAVAISGDTSGWTLEAPVFVAGTKLFKTSATASSSSATATITPSAWSNPVKTEDTEAADLLRTDLNYQVERMDGLISDKVSSETFNALGTRVSAAESEILQTPTNISIAVSNIKTAGANLVKNSRCNSIVGWDPLAQCVESVVSDSKYGNVVEIERISGTGSFQKTFSVDKAKLANTSVVYFVVAKRISASGEFYFGGWADTWNKLSSSTQNKIDHGDGWYLYWATFNSGATIGTGDFGISTITGKWRFYAVGATVGNKPPSTWSEADGDIRTDIESCGINVTSKRILLNGNTEVVDSSGSVSRFSDGTFRSKRLITGGPGTDRIEIDGAVSDPSISIIDSTDAVKVEISPKLIPTLTEIANAGGSSALTLHSSAIISLTLTSTGSLTSDLGSVYNFGSLSFVMGKLGNIVTPAFSYSLIASRYTPDVDSYAKLSIDLQRYNGTSWITYASVLDDMAIDSSKSTAPTQYIISNIPAGTYRFSMEITVQKGDESTVSAQVTTTLNAPYTLSYPIQKTIIGKDGTAMVWSTSQYARYGADGMEVRYGNYGLRVNNSGIQKTVNGGTWTNL